MKYKAIIILIFSTVLFFACAPNTDKSKANTYENNTDSLVKTYALKYDSSIAKFDFILKSKGRLNSEDLKIVYKADTTMTDNIIRLSNALMLENKSKEALNYLDKALLSIDKKDTEQLAKIYFNKGLGWEFANNKDSMYFYYNIAILKDSFNIKYLFHRSKVYQEQKQFKKALSDINRAINIQPLNKGLYVTRGFYKSDLGDYNSALFDMKEIPSYMKNDAVVYRNRGFVFLKLKRYKECIEDCNLSIQLDSSDGSTFALRGNAKSNLQDFEGAYRDFKIAVELGNQEVIPVFLKYKEYFETHKQI